MRRFVLGFELLDLFMQLALLGFGLYIPGAQLAIVLNWDENLKEINLQRG